MKKILIISITMFILLLYSVTAGYSLYDLDNACKIIKQDHLQTFIDYECVFVNSTLYRLKYKVNNDLIFQDLKNLSDSELSYNDKSTEKDKDLKVEEYKTKYDLKYDTTKIKTDIIYLENNDFPISKSSDKIKIKGYINPYKNKSGYIDIVLDDTIFNSYGSYFTIGFGTLITEFSNSLSSENVSINGNTSTRRFLKLKKFAIPVEGVINFTGFIGTHICEFEQPTSTSNCLYKNTNNAIIPGKDYDDGDYNTYFEPTEASPVFIKHNISKESFSENASITIRSGLLKISTQEKLNNVSQTFNISSSCYNYDSDVINFRMLDNIGGFFYTLTLSCQTGTSTFSNILQLSEDNTGDFKPIIWELNYSLSNSTSKLLNPSLEIGTVDGSKEWNYTGIFFGQEINTSDFSSSIETALSDGSCNCTDCSLSGTDCLIPFNMYSERGGLLEYSSLYINDTFVSTNVNITIYDSESLNVLTGVNITTQYIGSETQYESTTTNGIVDFGVKLEGNSEDVSLILFQTDDTDYSTTIREVTVYRGLNNSINIYMTNTSNTATTQEVTFIAKDEDRVLLEGAIIKIYKRNPSTNQFIELTDLTTNPDGEATTLLTLNTVFYKFVVIYNDVQVYVSSAAYPISTLDETITLNCIVGESYSDYYLKTQGFIGLLQFTKITNESGYYSISYTSVNSVEACLNTSYTTNTVTIQNGETCLSGTSGILTSNIISVSSFSDVYGYLSLDFGGIEGKQTVRSLHNYLGLSNTTSDTGRLFIVFGLILLSGIVFIYAPIVGLLVFAVGILSIAFTKFTLIDIPFAMFIVGLVIFVIFALKKNDKK